MRAQLINQVIESLDKKTFLDIGQTIINRIKAPKTVGAQDPDTFFGHNYSSFDVIYIDFIPHKDKVIEAIEGALKILNEGGLIFLNNCNPQKEFLQVVPREHEQWTGDTWKAFVHFKNRWNVGSWVIDIENGLGVLIKNSAISKKEDKEAKTLPNLTYQNLSENRKELLNLMSVKDFKEGFNISDPPIKIWYTIPYVSDQNIGRYYNGFMEKLGDDEWACFLDGDAMFTTRDFGTQLEDIIKEYPEVGMFTCMTNRIALSVQLAGATLDENHDMKRHRERGAKFSEKLYTEVMDMPSTHPVNGVLMFVSKKAWNEVKFRDGFLCVDNHFHSDLLDAGFRVCLMKGVYVYHWWRGDGNKSHL